MRERERKTNGNVCCSDAEKQMSDCSRSKAYIETSTAIEIFCFHKYFHLSSRWINPVRFIDELEFFSIISPLFVDLTSLIDRFSKSHEQAETSQTKHD